MTNVIVKDGVAVHATNDPVVLPSGGGMIQFPSLMEGNIISVGGGDINSSNSVLHVVESIPEDYEGGKFLYDGEIWSLNPDYGE